MRQIKLTGGGFTTVDDDNYEHLSRWKWQLGNRGYPMRACPNSSGKVTTLTIHSVVMGKKDGFEIDHIDGDKTNNQRSNLRFATRGQNRANSRLGKNNKSGYRGVRLKDKKWVAQITVLGKNIYLGRFEIKEDAALAYNSAAEFFHKEFATLNQVKVEANV